MKASEQTIQQIERLIKKIVQKFPEVAEPTCLTDMIGLRTRMPNSTTM